MPYTKDENTLGLDPIAEAAAPEDMFFPGMKTGASSAESASTAKLNKTTRVGVGLNEAGSYTPEVGATFIDDATSVHDATVILDENLADVASRIVTMKKTLSSSNILNDLINAIDLISTTKVVELIAATARLTFVSANYSALDKLELRIAGGEVICDFPLDLLESNESVIYKADVNSGIKLAAGNLEAYCRNNPVGGDGVIDLYITYRLITL